MSVECSYNVWAAQYNTNTNCTRYMESLVLQEMVGTTLKDDIPANSFCLEIGCGTGKNAVWLIDNYDQIVSVDFSEEMLKVARNKVGVNDKVTFHKADITEDWSFIANNSANL